MSALAGASVKVSAAGDRIDRLAVYPFVPGVLGELRHGGARLGILFRVQRRGTR
jgi:hypothetical protein